MNQEKIGNGGSEIATKKEKIFTAIRRLRNDFIDEIPEQILKTDAPNYYLYKCRQAFLGTILNEIYLLKELKLIRDPEVLQQCNEYEVFAKSLRGKARITREDIAKANKILDILIYELKK
jgi:hypothetical protein